MFLEKNSNTPGRSWSNMSRTYEVYAMLYEKTGQPQKALEAFKNYKISRDSAFSQRLATNIKKLESTFLLEQQENELSLLNQRLQIQQWFSLALIVGFVLLGLLLRTYFKFYQQKKRHTEELARTVDERTASLQRTNEELQKFAFVASHDLKTPLRNISGFLTLLKRRSRKGISQEEANEYIDFALQATYDMNALIEDVLEYSRLEYLEPKVETFQLRPLLERTISELLVVPTQQKSEVELVGAFPTLLGNPVIFQQLFRNLIDNGLKYNNSAQPKVTISAERQPDQITLKVSDNGIGIPSEYQAQVFGIFKRLHTADKYEGTGIGLAICRKIVDYYQGQIAIENHIPNGTSFKITLPAKLMAE